jgi:hypothetical protein
VTLTRWDETDGDSLGEGVGPVLAASLMVFGTAGIPPTRTPDALGSDSDIGEAVWENEGGRFTLVLT